MTRDEAIAQEVRALVALDLEGLRSEWRRRWGPPPKLRSPELLRRLMAWRIQALAYGGLDAETRRQLRSPTSHTGPAHLQSGLRLVREWQGRPIEVEVIDGGYLFEGAQYRSLSKVARAITGVNWNGPRFFGLRADAVK